MKDGTAKLIIVMLLTVALGAADRAVHTYDACRFFHTYEAVKKTGAATDFWERVACSLILVKAT